MLVSESKRSLYYRKEITRETTHHIPCKNFPSFFFSFFLSPPLLVMCATSVQKSGSETRLRGVYYPLLRVIQVYRCASTSAATKMKGAVRSMMVISSCWKSLNLL